MSALTDLRDAIDPERFGGKAASLASTLREGLPVPDGFALSWRGAEAVVVREPAILSELRSRFEALSAPVAVRSSAVDEDSADASFAGQHATLLGVTDFDALRDAIGAVVASGEAQHAQHYRAERGASGDARVGVVVQRMVAASHAGVLFTRNPVTGAREDVVEAVVGLGELLVSGQATPTTLRLDPEDGSLREARAGAQSTILRLGSDGRTREDPQPNPVAAELDGDVLATLQALARRCEVIGAGPQDLEWAVEGGRVFLLQSRPITTGSEAPIPALLEDDPGENVLWSRVNIAEAYPGVMTPLAAEYAQGSFKLTSQPMFQRLGVLPKGPVRWPERPEDTPIAIIRGHAVANVDYLRGMMDRTPGTSGDDFEAGMFGRVREDAPVGEKARHRYPLIAWRLLHMLFTIRREMRELATRCHDWWSREVKRLEAATLDEALAVFAESCSPNSFASEVSVLQGTMAMLSPLVSAPVLALARPVASEEDALRLASGMDTLSEVDMLEEMWRVARAGTGREAFVAKHGFMGGAGNIAVPSWRMSAETVDRLLAQFANAPADLDPAVQRAKALRETQDAEERVFARSGFVRKRLLRAALRISRTYLPLREVGKAALLQWTDVGRAAAWRIGELLTEQGKIAVPEDAQHLTLDEIRGTAGREDFRFVVTRRKALHSRYEAMTLPEPFDAAALRASESGAADTEETGEMLRGVPVSAGAYTGRARVVLDPGDCEDFRAGDVLVCPSTDPSWSPLFSIAGAMVVDIGGMLSHAAIIARELGVPTVVNTGRGTKRIVDGQRVSVDGGTGEVLLHAKHRD